MKYQSDELNVLFSSDDNYVRHLCAAIYSLLYHNKDFMKINVFVIDNEISSESRKRLGQVINEFDNTKIIFLDFTEWKSKLHLNLAWEISLSSYARLFVGEILPEYVDRIIYLDCDMIVSDSLRQLWRFDLGDNLLAAVQDFVSIDTKKSVGLEKNDKYFNAGMLLIDITRWRRERTGKDCMHFIEERNGTVGHHDQGVLNGVFKHRWTRLPLKYNVMTINYIISFQQMKKYFGDLAEYYSEEEREQAKTNPVILHFTPSFTSRPWFSNCCHPLKNKYWEALSATPWREVKPIRDTSKWYIKLEGWRYRHFPV